MNCHNESATVAIILAGGSGSRMGADITKQKMTIRGITVLERTLLAFEEARAVDSVIIVARNDEIDFADSVAKRMTKVISVVCGGKSRAESALNGFLAIENNADIVMIHDAARCLIAPEDINAIAEAAKRHGAASAATPVTDTIKQLGPDGMIKKTIPRNGIVAVGTPQAFKYDIYKRAIEQADLSAAITDDNMLVEEIGVSIVPVMTRWENYKITSPSDVTLAELVIGKREGL